MAFPPPFRSGPSNKIPDLLLPYQALTKGHEFVVLDAQGSPMLHLFPTFLHKYIWLIVYLDLATSSRHLKGGIRWLGSGTNVRETLRPGPSSDVTCPQAWSPSPLSVALASTRPLWPLRVGRGKMCPQGMDPTGGATLKKSLEIVLFMYILTPRSLFLKGVAFFLERAFVTEYTTMPFFLPCFHTWELIKFKNQPLCTRVMNTDK